jgi:hypothetical protein
MTKTLDPLTLRQFTGSEHWYRHWCVRQVLFTDGVKYVADEAGAYWLIDEIALTIRHEANLAAESFQHWTLSVADDHTATIVCTDGNSQELFRKALEFTDFPLPRIEFYACENELGPRHFTLMLPSEY